MFKLPISPGVGLRIILIFGPCMAGLVFLGIHKWEIAQQQQQLFVYPSKETVAKK